MSGGPFRDTLTPLIDEAERELAELRKRRAKLEVRYENARKRLDAKALMLPDSSAVRLERLRADEIVWPGPDALKKPIIAGVIVGLLTWLKIFSQHH
jgi:hypothetical protein